MIRCRGFRRDAFLDDPGRAGYRRHRHPWPAYQKLHEHECGDILDRDHQGTPILPESRWWASPVLLLAGERVAGYRRDKRLLAPTR
jgi:hypothetical protein